MTYQEINLLRVIERGDWQNRMIFAEMDYYSNCAADEICEWVAAIENVRAE